MTVGVGRATAEVQEDVFEWEAHLHAVVLMTVLDARLCVAVCLARYLRGHSHCSQEGVTEDVLSFMDEIS